MHHLNSVSIKRFKSITDLNLELGRTTVLVGTNNSGKSSILQSIQFGISAIQSLYLSSDKKTKVAETGTLSADQLVYTPLRDVHTLAQGGKLKQDKSQAIEIEFNTDLGINRVQVRRGKNRNLNVTLEGDPQVTRILEDPSQPYSAIAPGLAGIPSAEEHRSPGIVRRAAAYGDANSVFRNVLWILKQDPSSWTKFQDRLRDIYDDVEIEIEFDEHNDLYIEARVNRADESLPIDASGTGILQAAQILSYIGVYRPSLLILDEPDSHLHPSNQRRLIQLLDEIAESEGFQVLLSTHSRHILDECITLGSKIHWIDNGQIQSHADGRLPVLMSLGALDVGDRLKDGDITTVVLTEDSGTKLLQTLLKANGFDTNELSIWSYNGCTQISAARVLASFLADMAPGCSLLIHRDRDYLNNSQIEDMKESFSREGFDLFVTRGIDIESHYLEIGHLCEVYPDESREEIESLLSAATVEVQEESIRIMANERFRQAVAAWDKNSRHPEAGNITAATRVEYMGDPERFRHGKKVLNAFNRLAQNAFGSARDIAVSTSSLEDASLQKFSSGRDS